MEDLQDFISKIHDSYQEELKDKLDKTIIDEIINIYYGYGWYSNYKDYVNYIQKYNTVVKYKNTQNMIFNPKENNYKIKYTHFLEKPIFDEKLFNYIRGKYNERR